MLKSRILVEKIVQHQMSDVSLNFYEINNDVMESIPA